MGPPLRLGAQLQAPYFRKLRRLEHDPEKARERHRGRVPVFGKACSGRDPWIMFKEQAEANLDSS
jgi:hypothetical protein